jgi:hypothetical protein
MDDPASPEYQAIAESQRRAAAKRQAFDEYAAQADAEREAFNKGVDDYYKGLREKHSDYSNLGWEFSDEDYLFIDAVQPAIENAEDPQLLKERIAAAGMYSNLFQVPISTAFQNLEDFHQQWTGKNFVKKTGLEAVADSIRLNFVSAEYNRLSKELAKSGGNDPVLLEAIQEHERMLDRLKDHAPKFWQDDYVKMGGWHDVVRSLATSVAENLGPIATGIGASALAATGVGAIAGAAGLSAATSALLVAGASRTAIAASTYNSTWGIKYREMTNEGIPHDIAQAYAKIDAGTEGIIEALLGGLESAGGRAIASSIVPGAVTRATNRWFISGKMSLAAKATLGWLKEGFEEGSEEFLQGISSGQVFNLAADAANQRRIELLQKIAEEPFEEIRKELEKELEKHPEVDKQEWGAILREAKEGGIAGFLTGLILGVPVEIVGYRADVRAAKVLADIAKDSPNMAAFKENLKAAKAAGFNNPFTEGLKTDEEAALLSDIYKIQQERMSPEEREAKQKAIQDASALAEVTDYSNAEVEDTPELDEKGQPTGGTQPEIVTNAEGNIYRNDTGRLETSEYTDTTEDGGIEGRYVAGDPRTPTEDGNRYGYINYTEKDGTITIDDFKMLEGYASLREDFYRQFAEDHPGQNIVWNPKNEQNIAIREQMINSNPRGPKNGLNYFENVEQAPVSAEAREVARRFSPYLTNSTPLETALAVETFRAFYQKRGESLQSAMSRLLGRVTNTAPDAAIAAQRAGQTVKGATWLEQTAEGMRHVIYLSKNAADSSTVVHEISHAVAADFTEAERNIAARTLNGYKLKNGTTVSFEENSPWTDEQHEAFAEALENYLTNGTAPNEEIKGLFERIKEFMKRIYQKMKGWTELSPQVEQFYKSLLSGEMVDQARSENASQTHEEGRRSTPHGKMKK